MIYSSVHNYYIVFVKLCQERFSAIFVLPSRIAAAEKMTCGFLLRKCDLAAVKIHDNDVREPVLSHVIFDWMKCAWRAYHTRQYKFLLKSAFLCWKTLDKTACLWYHIPCKWARLTTQHFSLRGIAQLVEQRSPNVNRNSYIRINTAFLRLETSVSSLFSCLDFCKLVNWIMQNRLQILQKIPEHHQKTSTFPSAEKGQLILFWVMEICFSQ